MKVALVHDFLNQIGGAEQVLSAICEIFPDAPIYTITYDKDKMGSFLKGRDIRTSFLQKRPMGIKKYKWYLKYMPTAIESFDLSDYDLVISDASAFAKGVITKPETTHICYCHTPTRYLWNETHFYIKTAHIPWPATHFLPEVLTNLRMWDYVAAQRPDCIIANSKEVKDRIQKYYRRDSEVIHPFVDSAKFKTSEKLGNYFLIAGRMVPYKRNDIVIQAFNDLKIPLKVVGDGFGMPELKALAKSDKIEFLGRVSDHDLAKYYSECLAYIFPAEEDFGIMPLEAMASGRPVIAYRAGGVIETIKEGITGTFFNEQTPQCLVDTIKHFNPEKYNSKIIRQHAMDFDKNIFKKKIESFIEKHIK